MHAFKPTALFQGGVQNPTGLAHVAAVGNQDQKFRENIDFFVVVLEPGKVCQEMMAKIRLLLYIRDSYKDYKMIQRLQRLIIGYLSWKGSTKITKIQLLNENKET